MRLTDNFSRLHQYKVQRGLYKKQTSGTSAYILECQLRRAISKELQETSAVVIARSLGITLRRFQFLIEKKLYTLEKEGLKNALDAYYNGSIEDCIRSINNASTPRQ
ncbi:MAG: hypothetical protein AAGN35_15245 [Bacteroidota bacterium]